MPLLPHPLGGKGSFSIFKESQSGFGIFCFERLCWKIFSAWASEFAAAQLHFPPRSTANPYSVDSVPHGLMMLCPSPQTRPSHKENNRCRSDPAGDIAHCPISAPKVPPWHHTGQSHVNLLPFFVVIDYAMMAVIGLVFSLVQLFVGFAGIL